MTRMAGRIAAVLFLTCTGCEMMERDADDPGRSAIEAEGEQRIQEVERSLDPEERQLEMERQRIEQQRAQIEQQEQMVEQREDALEQRREEHVGAIRGEIEAEERLVEQQAELREAEQEAAERRAESQRELDEARTRLGTDTQRMEMEGERVGEPAADPFQPRPQQPVQQPQPYKPDEAQP